MDRSIINPTVLYKALKMIEKERARIKKGWRFWRKKEYRISLFPGIIVENTLKEELFRVKAGGKIPEKRCSYPCPKDIRDFLNGKKEAR